MRRPDRAGMDFRPAPAPPASPRRRSPWSSSRPARSPHAASSAVSAGPRLIALQLLLALSAISIALPRWAIASWNALRRSAASPALPHHSIAGSAVAGLREMMRDELGLRVGRGEQRLGRAAMQRLPAALQQALVGRVLDQRVLEAIGRVGGVPSTNSRSASASFSSAA